MAKPLIEVDEGRLGADRAELGTTTIKDTVNEAPLLATAAESLDLGVLHYDGDVDLIAAATGQGCSGVVSAGSAE